MEKQTNIKSITINRFIPREWNFLKVGDKFRVYSLEKLMQNEDLLSSLSQEEKLKLSSVAGQEIVITEEIIQKLRNCSMKTLLTYINHMPIYCDMIELHEDTIPVISGSDFKNLSIKQDEKDQSIIDEMISQVDFELMCKMFNVAVSSAHEHREAEKSVVKDYLQKWAEAKYEFYLLFGRKLSINKSINVDITNNEMNTLIQDLSIKYEHYSPIINMFTTQEFIDNKCDDKLLLSVYCDKEFKKGMKVSKFLSTYIKDNQFDIDVSKILQNRKTKGYITISIDPCDYLTMSINSHNWISCHNIAHGGWLGASFAMMQDQSTLVAFKHNNMLYDYSINGESFKFNSKQQRELIHIDKNSCSVAFNRSSYGSMSSDVQDNIRYMIEEQISNYLSVDNLWDLDTTGNDTINKFVKDNNDFHYHDPQEKMIGLTGKTDYSSVVYEIGVNELICPMCGCIMEHRPSNGVMCCRDCE